jgi:hypothetical protein
MKVPFPYLGLDEGSASAEQPPGTSFSLNNVRPYDITSERIRGGQRPALVKAYTTQISGASHPVLHICSVVTTYITPEE